MNKQEAIEKIKNLNACETFMSEIIWVKRDDVLDIIKQLDEPQKPKVPQFVADWYEEHKDYFEDGIYELCVQFYQDEVEPSTNLYRWFYRDDGKPIETLVKMRLYGYEVEKDKLYTVELPNPNAGGHVVLCKTSDGIVSIAFTGMARWQGCKNFQLTEAEIKKDFDWAWKFRKEVEE